jgi:hypothetical protein
MRLAEECGHKNPAGVNPRHLSAQNFSAKWFGESPAPRPNQRADETNGSGRSRFGGAAE